MCFDYSYITINLYNPGGARCENIFTAIRELPSPRLQTHLSYWQNLPFFVSYIRSSHFERAAVRAISARGNMCRIAKHCSQYTFDAVETRSHWTLGGSIINSSSVVGMLINNNTLAIVMNSARATAASHQISGGIRCRTIGRLQASNLES